MAVNRPGNNRPRRSSNRTVRTRSGKELKVNSSLGERWTAIREAKSRRKVDRLIGLPKSRFKRLMWRLHPKRVAAYWFSRDGAIMALKIVGIAIVFFFILTLAVFAYFRKDLPNIKDISGDNLGGSISYYDRTGKVLLWQDNKGVKRIPCLPSGGCEISQYMKDATVAIEDRDFYKHRGFDVRGIARAGYNDLKGGSRQGGSTITEQLVKLTNEWTQQRTVGTKAKELILAVELERTYTKDEILTGYLNTAPYGSIDYGVQTASQDYFHKDPKDLTLPEAAFLAAIPQSPSIYSPYVKDYFDKDALLTRWNYVIDVMQQTGKITKIQADEAKKDDILAEVQAQPTDLYAGIKAPYFVLAAQRQLESPKSGFVPNDGNGSAKIGGWKVITTVDMNLQALAEQQVQKGLAEVERQGGDEIAFAAEDTQTGQMVALVGGVDFNDKNHGRFNYAQTPLSPGSSFKAYDYTTLIENSSSAGAGSVLYDSQGPVPGYQCTDKSLPSPTNSRANCIWDFDRRYPGPETIRYAIGGSRNVPAIKAININGVQKTIDTAQAMGLKSGYNCYVQGANILNPGPNDKTDCGASSGIGDGAYLYLDEHVNGYATLSRLGQYVPQTYILQIQNASDKTLYKWKQPKGQQVVRQDSAYIMADMLSDPRPSYFPAGNKPQVYGSWKFAVKTGTTNDAKDGLMMGFSTKYAAGVWVGYHNRTRAMSGSMETMTEPIWRGWMTAAHKPLPVQNWTEPSDIQHLPAFVITSHIGFGSQEPSPSIDIYPSWYKPKTGTTQSATMDKVSNKVATSCTPELAKQTLKGSSTADHFSVDIYYGNGAATSGQSNTTANDDVHSCSDSPPNVASVYVGGTDVTNGGSANCDNSCTITTTVSAGTHPFNDPNYSQFPGTVNLLIDGQVAQSKQVTDSPSTVSFTYSGSSGTHTLAIQVIDSVLYDDTSNQASLNVTGNGGDGNHGPGQTNSGSDPNFRLTSRQLRHLGRKRG
jgi:membrane peptidoglycan carboxypeptidase